MTSGLILRVDQGGLANQTQALAECLQPDRVLAVDLPEHQRRGDSQIDRLVAHHPIVVTVETDVIPTGVLTEFARSVDTLITVECLYTNPAGWAAVNKETRTVLVANPELYADYPAQQIVLPTSWHADQMPPNTIVPHPVDLATAAPHSRLRAGPVRTFLHVEAPAMCDRNGSELVAAALPLITEPCTLIVRSHRGTRGGVFADNQVGRVRVVWDNTRPEQWVDCYHADDTDVLVMPRRYGGLSMVAQEAAALGVPSIMLDVDPQHSENWPGWRVPAHRLRTVRMRGGDFPVHTCRPEVLAETMTALARGELDAGAESRRALAWANSRGWLAVADRWHEALG